MTVYSYLFVYLATGKCSLHAYVCTYLLFVRDVRMYIRKYICILSVCVLYIVHMSASVNVYIIICTYYGTNCRNLTLPPGLVAFPSQLSMYQHPLKCQEQW